MADRVGQLWVIESTFTLESSLYLVVDPGERDVKCKRWLHRALNVVTGEMTTLQDADMMTWELIKTCVRYG